MSKQTKTETAALTAEALRQQRPAAEAAIETARTEVDEARAAQEAAFTAFATSETEDNERAFASAELRLRVRELALAKKQAELATLDGAIETAARAEQEHTVAELEQKLASDPIGEALYKRAANELLVPLGTLGEIRANNVARQGLAVELEAGRIALGHRPTGAFAFQSVDVEPQVFTLREHVMSIVGQLGGADPRWRIIQQLLGS